MIERKTKILNNNCDINYNAPMQLQKSNYDYKTGPDELHLFDVTDARVLD